MKYILHGLMYLIGALFTYIGFGSILYMSSSAEDYVFFILFFPLSAAVILVFNITTRKRILINYSTDGEELLDDLDFDLSQDITIPKLKSMDLILGILVIISGGIAIGYLLNDTASDMFRYGFRGDSFLILLFLLFGASILIVYPIRIFNVEKRLKKKVYREL